MATTEALYLEILREVDANSIHDMMTDVIAVMIATSLNSYMLWKSTAKEEGISF
jgi:hypothetical protein